MTEISGNQLIATGKTSLFAVSTLPARKNFCETYRIVEVKSEVLSEAARQMMTAWTLLVVE